MEPPISREFRMKGESPGRSGSNAHHFTLAVGERGGLRTDGQDPRGSDEHAWEGRTPKPLHLHVGLTGLGLGSVVIPSDEHVQHSEGRRIAPRGGLFEITGEQNQTGTRREDRKSVPKAVRERFP